jgi:hypothetical protein
MGPVPDRPLTSDCHISSGEHPIGEIAPMPVTTTRWSADL